jgi:hypothetical protein
MSIITIMVYKTDSVGLEKSGNDEWTLTVNWEGDKKKFWINFPWPLLSITKQEKLGEQKKRFYIKAKTIQTMDMFLKKKQKHLNYDDSIICFYDIGNQLQTLERFNMGLPFLNINDIIVVDERHFFYLNDKNVYDFAGNNTMEIDKISKKGSFISPEFENLTSIPSEVHYKSGFYSLGSIITYSMFNKVITQENKHHLLDPINTTKLYWALLRILEYEPSDRYYLII